MAAKSSESSDDDSEWLTDDDAEIEMDDIRRIIGDIFPSKYIKNKIISAEEDRTQLDETTKMKTQFGKMKDKFEGGSNRDFSIKKPSKGEKPKSEKPKGEKPKGEKSKGEKSKGEKSKGEKPKSEKSKGEKPKGEKPKGEKPKSEKPKSEKSKCKNTKCNKKKSTESEDSKMDMLMQEMFGNHDNINSSNDTESEYEDDTEDEEDSTESETESEEESGEDSESGSSDEDEDAVIEFGKSGLFNILLTMGQKMDELDAEDESETESEESDESEEEDEKEEEKEKKKRKNKNKHKNSGDTEVDSSDEEDAITDMEAYTKVRAMISGLSDKDKNNKEMRSIIKDFETRENKYKKKEKKQTQKVRNKNAEKFQKVIKEKNSLNDTKFFRDRLTVDEQNKVLLEVEELKKHMEVDKPYRLTLIDADIPVIYKSIAFKKINSLKYMDEGGGEYYKIKNWVDTFMQIPFNEYRNIPLTIDDGVEKCHEFMKQSKKTLDEAVYGMDDAKLQIMQMVGQWIANPEAIGSAIAIKGPMGTGKTTLVKDGISQILGREFAFIALGGATDSSFLEGHSYTYEGSTWGKIVDILIQCKSMNPVIYFDELDKVSETPKGEEINGILTHLTDTTQNSKFHDKYFSELDFDLSRCLFIFSYNDESKVNPILKDRMYRIQTKGYDVKQKTIIAKNYLIPKIKEQVKFKEEDIVICDDVIKHIIEKYTDGEQGVRNLKRCLEIIHTKLNLYRLMKPETNLFEKDMKLKIVFPVNVTTEIVDNMIKIAEQTGNWHHMYN
jgi:ATP-dependent Lon protease